MSVDIIMSGTEDATPYQIPESLLETFPFLTSQAGEALTRQLEFLTSATNIVLPSSSEDPGGERLSALIQKAKTINELLSCLYQGSELLARLGQHIMVELYKAKSWEVRETLKEIQNEILKLLPGEQAILGDEDEVEASEELEALKNEIARERRGKEEKKSEKKNRISKRKEQSQGRKSRSYCKHCGRY